MGGVGFEIFGLVVQGFREQGPGLGGAFGLVDSGIKVAAKGLGWAWDLDTTHLCQASLMCVTSKLMGFLATSTPLHSTPPRFPLN